MYFTQWCLESLKFAKDDVYTILKAEPSYISQKKVKEDIIYIRPGGIHK